MQSYFDSQKRQEWEALAPSWELNDTRAIKGQAQSTAEATQAQEIAVEGLLCGSGSISVTDHLAWASHFSDDDTRARGGYPA